MRSALLSALLALCAASPAPLPSPVPLPDPDPLPFPVTRPAIRPALLILRDACGGEFPSEAEVAAAVAARSELANLRVKLLAYNETCGLRWDRKSFARALSTLGSGGVVGGAVSGVGGTAACSTLRAAAGALARASPAACAAPEARAAVVATLAKGLRWHRVYVPPITRCPATLNSVIPALIDAGSHVIRIIVPQTLMFPEGEVVCDTGAGEKATIARAALYLRMEPETLHEQVRPMPATGLGPNLTHQFDATEHEGHRRINIFRRDRRDEKDMSEAIDDVTLSVQPRSMCGQLVDEPQAMLLADRPARAAPLQRALDDLQRQLQAERIGAETVSFTFGLHERVGGEWHIVALLTAEGRRPLHKPQWSFIVVPHNSSCDLRHWYNLHGSFIDLGEWKTLVMVVLCTFMTLLMLCCLIGCIGLLRLMREQWRMREDVVLDPEDFAFPPDERRVGEGMETMLSCWLQRLHEFGGPELERPDLLKRPSRVPSVPSSTCSVNRLAADRRIKYKGEPVHMRTLPTPAPLELRRRSLDVLLVLQALRHENINPFLGCLCEARPALVWEWCGRGSLEDVLIADDIRLDWTFRLSLLTDLARGLRYLHASSLRAHGRLTSRACVVDARWVLRVSDLGVPALAYAQGLTLTLPPAKELLWTAPELLREWRAAGQWGKGSAPGDVFSFAIIMQEVIVRGEPYCMLALSPDEIIEKLVRPPPLIRPSVSMGAAPPDAVNVMRQCWSEAPDMRPDLAGLFEAFREMHRGKKINIVDSMFEMLEKYSNNLEELIRDRTEQLDMEKKKTEQLLNRMLPSSVAERLLLGGRVEPEEFSEVSIYFSDIVGFTALAARSTPVQVVDLLNELYTRFDAAIEQYRVYKVETIGDAYMVVGGLPARAADHAESVATMALHLLHEAGRARVRHLRRPVLLRAGLHSGAVCAGVVGRTMPRYCLFGDAVNTAARMESTGAAWRIQLSAATAARLARAGGYRLRARGRVRVKGKGAMLTYWLLGKDGFDKLLPEPPPLESEELLVEAVDEVEGEALLRAMAVDGVPPSPPHRSPPPSEPASPEPELSPADERPEPLTDRFAWQRSGAASADSSPPRAPPADPAAPCARHRCVVGGRALRRQWSLETAGEPLPRYRMRRDTTLQPS